MKAINFRSWGMRPIQFFPQPKKAFLRMQDSNLSEKLLHRCYPHFEF